MFGCRAVHSGGEYTAVDILLIFSLYYCTTLFVNCQGGFENIDKLFTNFFVKAKNKGFESLLFCNIVSFCSGGEREALPMAPPKNPGSTSCTFLRGSFYCLRNQTCMFSLRRI